MFQPNRKQVSYYIGINCLESWIFAAAVQFPGLFLAETVHT